MIKGWVRQIRAASALAMAVMLGGCQAYTDISSTKAAEFDQEFKRYSIVNYAMPVLPDEYVASFQAGMLNRLTACGANAAFTRVVTHGNELTFDADSEAEVTTNEARLQELNPDAILVVREELTQRRGMGTVTLSRFFVELSDRTTQKPVWKASVEMHPQTGTPAEFGAILARDLTARMVRDGLLGNCAGKRV